MRTCVTVISDTHCNSELGLCPPGPIDLDGGGKYTPRPEQDRMWEWWEDFIAQRPKASKHILVVNGDVVEGIHSRSKQIISDSIAFQTDLAVRCLRPIARGVSKMYFMKGTPYHVGAGAEQENLVAAHFKAEKSDSGDRTFSELDLEVDGVWFDFKHTPLTKGSNHTTRGPATSRLATLIKGARVASKDLVPDVAIRSHIHKVTDSGMTMAPWTWTTPCWKYGRDDYLNKIGIEETADVGGMYFVIENGALCLPQPIFRRIKRSAPKRKA